MTKIGSLRAFAKLAMMAAAAWCNAAQADGFWLVEPAGCGAIQTVNQTPKWAWITIYDAGQLRHLDYGYVAPFATRTWKAGMYSCAGVYHVRAEVKDFSGPAQPPGNPPNIFDTRVEVTFGNDHDVYLQTPIAVQLTDADATHWIYQGTPWKFWWAHNGNLPAPGAMGLTPSIGLNNYLGIPVQLNITGSGDSATQCVSNNAQTRVNLHAGPHTVKWTMGCDGAGPGGSRSVNLGYGALNMSVPNAYTSGNQILSDSTAIAYVNNSGYAASVAVSGAPTTCVAPHTNATIPIQPGSHDMQVTVKASCSAAGGAAFPKWTTNYPRNTISSYAFNPSLQ
jgi:hypothetical protein